MNDVSEVRTKVLQKKNNKRRHVSKVCTTSDEGWTVRISRDAALRASVMATAASSLASHSTTTSAKALGIAMGLTNGKHSKKSSQSRRKRYRCSTDSTYDSDSSNVLLKDTMNAESNVFDNHKKSHRSIQSESLEQNDRADSQDHSHTIVTQSLTGTTIESPSDDGDMVSSLQVLPLSQNDYGIEKNIPSPIFRADQLSHPKSIICATNNEVDDTTETTSITDDHHDLNSSPLVLVIDLTGESVQVSYYEL